MAPEYAMHGYLSVKTDVFSYGVLVLEIIGGRKNHDGQLGAEKADLLGYVSYFSEKFRMPFNTKVQVLNFVENGGCDLYCSSF